jgi:hypothetical protein
MTMTEHTLLGSAMVSVRCCQPRAVLPLMRWSPISGQLSRASSPGTRTTVRGAG